MTKPTIKVAVVSDVVCPWCYIGKRRMEKAVQALSNEFDFEIAYYPFELNPHMPAEGLDQKQYLSDKFGGEEAYEQTTGHVADVAAAEGLIFNFEKQYVSPNTRNAHRLVLFAKEHKKDLVMVERLFKAYFTDGLNLSDHNNLLDLAEEVGLNRNDTRLFLESDTGIKEVLIAESELQRMGIRGVPFYIINDQFGISGAQPTQSFTDAFRNVGKELISQANSCEIDSGKC